VELRLASRSRVLQIDTRGRGSERGEIERYFTRQFNVSGVITACEYLADQGRIGKASIAARLTKRSTTDVQKLAFFLGSPGVLT
jgi:hypothetical protein